MSNLGGEKAYPLPPLRNLTQAISNHLPRPPFIEQNWGGVSKPLPQLALDVGEGF